MSARRYWAWVLAAAVAVSVAGNVGHAILTANPALRTPAAVAAALPPLALLAVTEGLARSHGRGVRRRVYRAGVGGAVVIAALAFVLSFAALRDLAVMLGQPAAVAAGWPLLADATIAVASIMVLALKPDEAATTPAAPVAGAVAGAVASGNTSAAAAGVDGEATGEAGEAAGVDGEVVGVDGGVAGVAGGVAGEFRELAEQLVREGRVRAPAATVAAALAALAGGRSLRATASATGLHRTAVRRLAGLAAEVG